MTLHHRAEGPLDAPSLYLGPSLGTSLAVWDKQAPALARQYRVVRWDLPGHGASPTGLLPTPAAMADLGRLVLDLADSLGHDSFAYAGISLGGAVGTWLAAHHPSRITSLTLVCSSARFGEPQPWLDRAELMRTKGAEPLAATARDRWFTPAFAASGDLAVDSLPADLRSVDPESYAGCCEVLAGLDLRPDLARITAPTLVVAGRDDKATPPPHARALADGIRDTHLVELPRAAHLANVEQPRAVLDALLTRLGSAPDGIGPDRGGDGMAVRRAVLREELAMHVRAALRNGLTPDEIADVLREHDVNHPWEEDR
ncbi:alpha/beta fold hydrolase [Streptomyces sp. NPDC060064]|uniref:alpha/beta fold hydrolase n=1 Tax=Streptomyces sp. NPDC060064 TaxID=3347049 RepID=UPI0036B8BC59